MKEHIVDVCTKCIKTSTLVEHSLKTKHRIYMHNVQIIVKEDHYFTYRFKETLKIVKHLEHMSRDEGVNSVQIIIY
jgi:hypothetical protein